MSKAILDTSVLIADDVAPLVGELAISVVSLAELHFGVLVTSEAAIRAGAVDIHPAGQSAPVVFSCGFSQSMPVGIFGRWG